MDFIQLYIYMKDKYLHQYGDEFNDKRYYKLKIEDGHRVSMCPLTICTV